MAVLRGLDAHPDEAVGADQGRDRLPGDRRTGVSGYRHRQADAGDGPDAARDRVQVLRRGGNDVRARDARRIFEELLDQPFMTGADSPRRVADIRVIAIVLSRSANVP